ncbi:MAG: fructose-specific PTS transporter subunit EIIC [Aerococcus sp.]|nr:fructose-specific PTS transporter subunit EIIC [Aerococcus sp.]
MGKYQIIAATGCPTGIAHTYMAQEALEQAAEKRGVSIKVETHGQTGVENALTDEEIREADGVIVAADKDVAIERFAGKRVINVSVSKGIKMPDELVDRILNDDQVPIYHADKAQQQPTTEKESVSAAGIGHQLYVYLMNGVSHMLPLVVAGGVLTACSFFWGIHSAEQGNPEFNQFAYLLNTIGGFAMNLMVPVLAAYIAEAIAKRSGLIVGFTVGMIAYTNGTGFLGGLVGGFLAGGVVLVLNKLFAKLPKSIDGLKAIFILPVLGTLIAGLTMWYLSVPMEAINEGMMNFLKQMEDANPIILGAIVGAMCAFDMGGPVNKAAYLTGTALLAQGNYYFMAGVSAACMVPPLATGVSVLLNKKAYTEKERSAGYVNFLLGATHITEGAIPFAAKNPLINIPIFMFGSAIAAILSYVTRTSVPAPHGGFIVLPIVNRPFMWVIDIFVGAVIAGILLAFAEGRTKAAPEVATEAAATEATETTVTAPVAEASETPVEDEDSLGSILKQEYIQIDVPCDTRDAVLDYLSITAEKLGLTTNSEAVYQKYQAREASGSTGMERGIAIPHAEDASIKQPAMLILKLRNGVEWESFDGQPIDTVISFLIPESGGEAHLHYLSETSKRLMQEDFVDQLKAANDAYTIYRLFTETEA